MSLNTPNGATIAKLNLSNPKCVDVNLFVFVLIKNNLILIFFKKNKQIHLFFKKRHLKFIIELQDVLQQY